MTNIGGMRPARIERDSVNSVVVDNEPQDKHERMMVAARVALNPSGSACVAKETTLMPNIHGLPHIVCLLFAPTIEMRCVMWEEEREGGGWGGRREVDDGGDRVEERRGGGRGWRGIEKKIAVKRGLLPTHRTDELKRQYTGAICGLGYDPSTGQSLYHEHDIEITFDTLITQDDLDKVHTPLHTHAHTQTYMTTCTNRHTCISKTTHTHTQRLNGYSLDVVGHRCDLKL